MSEKMKLSEEMLALAEKQGGLPADWTKAATTLDTAHKAAFDEDGFARGSKAVMAYVNAWRWAARLWKEVTGERLVTPGQAPGVH